jgi:hypothetical protein
MMERSKAIVVGRIYFRACGKQHFGDLWILGDDRIRQGCAAGFVATFGRRASGKKFAQDGCVAS